MLKQLLLTVFILGVNYKGALQFDKDFEICENYDWSKCAVKVYDNYAEMWRLYNINDRSPLVKGLLYYNFASPAYTDGQILANAYIIVPFIASKLI